MNKIDENWDLFEHKTKIRTYLKELDENWDKKKYFNLELLSRFIIHVHLYRISILCYVNLHFNASPFLLFSLLMIISHFIKFDQVTDWNGSEIDLAADRDGRRIIYPSDGILVTNGHIHNQVLQIIYQTAGVWCLGNCSSQLFLKWFIYWC